MRLDGARLAARSLRKQPMFAATVVVSLALGIALNTTMYGMLDALIKPRIDVRDPGQLYWIRFYGDYKSYVDNRARDVALSTGMHDYEAVTRTELSFRGQSFEHGQNMAEGIIQGVASNYFDVLGARAIAGRTFMGSDETAIVSPLVVDETLVTRLFPTGDSPIGATVIVDRQPRTIVGVVSRFAHLPGERGNAWEIAPLRMKGTYTRLIRLRPGASPQAADRELQVIAARFAAQSGETVKDVAFRFHQAADPEFQFRPIHFGLISAVVAVLLIACANLANIQLARGIGRRRELALRSALGATRGRIIAHLLIESMLLGGVGLLLGLVLTYWGAAALHASIPPAVGEYIVEPQITWRVLAFALGATLFCLVTVGVLPAISVSRTDPNEVLKSGAGTGATKRNRRRYAVLVCIEIGLALALTSVASLTVHSWMLSRRTGYGFDPRPLATGYLGALYAPGTVVPISSALQTMALRIGGIPGVALAATTMSRGIEGLAVTVEDAGGAREFVAPGAGVEVVSPSYVRTMGWPIVQGRDFLDGERDHAAVIVDGLTARKLWPNANPIGALLKLGDKKSNLPYVRVVGVIGEQPGFEDPDPYGAQLRSRGGLGRILYLPGPTDTAVSGRYKLQMSFVVRTHGSPDRLAVNLRHEIGSWGDVNVSLVSTMIDFLGITRNLQSTRFVAFLFVLFAGLGIALAAFGVYGVVAHAVAERRRELGVRVALGATPRDILNAVLRETVIVALSGAATGLLLTKYGVMLASNSWSPDVYNAPLFAAVALAVVSVAAASALIPAMRATRIDPTESLRCE